MVQSFYRTAILGLWILSSCGKTEDTSSDDQRLMKLELKIEQIEQQNKSDERVFLDNIHLLRDYVSSHRLSYDTHDEEQSKNVVDAGYFSERTKESYSDFKSWSKRALDGFSGFFVGNTEGGR